jgi:hypothetical protein
MPDSFPPLTWGPPFDERDLDVLLSGDMTDTPLALRQVADALTALRAAPAQAELRGEAAARAEFRALAGLRAAGQDEAARTDGQAHTLVLPAQAPDRAGTRQARHRGGRSARRPRGARAARPNRARPPGRRLGQRGGVLMAVAAAALIVIVVAVTGSLPGPMHRAGHSSAVGTPSAAHPSAGSRPSQNVQDGSASPEPTRKPTSAYSGHKSPSGTRLSPAQAKAKTLCRDFYGYFLHPLPLPQPQSQPQSHDKLSAEEELFWRIAALAGGPFGVQTYCDEYVRDMFPPGKVPVPWSPGGGPVTPQQAQNPPGNGQQATSNLPQGQTKKNSPAP